MLLNKIEDYTISDLVISNTNTFIAMNKPAGIPSQKDTSGEKSIRDLAEIYTKKKVFLLHRLDRPVGGVMLFGKKKTFDSYFAEMQQNGKVEKKYFAVCSKADVEKQGVLENYLGRDGKRRKAFITDEKKGKLSKLSYEIIKELDNYFLVRVKMNTGRFHQIRAQLSNIGLHINGDVKYGARRANKDKRIFLHAYSIAFQDMTTQKPLLFSTPPLEMNPLWETANEFML